MKASSLWSGILLASVLSLITASSALAEGYQGGGESTSSSGAPNPRAVSMYNLGLAAYKQGSPESAVIFFKRACDIDPNLADAQYNLAVIYQAEKRFKDALPRFEEVLRIKPSDPDAQYQMGAILQDLGRYGEAKTHLSAIAPNNVHFTDAQRRLAQINQQQAAGLQGLPTQPSSQPPAYYNPGWAATQPPVQQPQSNDPLGGVAINATPAPAIVVPTQPNPYAAQQPPSNYAQPPQANYGQPPAQVLPQPQSQATPQPSTQSIQPYGAQVQVPQSQAPVPPSQLATPNPVPVLAHSTLRVIATGFNAPAGLAFDKAGNLYVANYMTNSIDRIAPDGTRSAFSTGVTLRGPIGLVADEASNVYVANYSSGTVARISPAGVSTVIATGFHKPYYLTLDHDGNLYVSQQEDNSIVRITLPKATPTALK